MERLIRTLASPLPTIILAVFATFGTVIVLADIMGFFDPNYQGFVMVMTFCYWVSVMMELRPAIRARSGRR
ncbi:hypothetical protein LK12_04180 [Novosphingobium malaysiense]|uniref:Uncharacterized protein n=1 Tax=Novosphingobium malaysiense TaxID=1348853 RepID=A0A0B1ZVH3_9SPHN|nr:hypothetical protein LK12_04180 [Novosphingobium malaysiense]